MASRLDKKAELEYFSGQGDLMTGTIETLNHIFIPMVL
jgi:hypothetical protein